MKLKFKKNKRRIIDLKWKNLRTEKNYGATPPKILLWKKNEKNSTDYTWNLFTLHSHSREYMKISSKLLKKLPKYEIIGFIELWRHDLTPPHWRRYPTGFVALVQVLWYYFCSVEALVSLSSASSAKALPPITLMH